MIIRSALLPYVSFLRVASFAFLFYKHRRFCINFVASRNLLGQFTIASDA
jgi:hypothetical protein